MVDEEKLKLFSESLFMLSEQCIKLSQINTMICEAAVEKLNESSIQQKKIKLADLVKCFDELSEQLFDDKKVAVDIKIRCFNPSVSHR